MGLPHKIIPAVDKANNPVRCSYISKYNIPRFSDKKNQLKHFRAVLCPVLKSTGQIMHVLFFFYNQIGTCSRKCVSSTLKMERSRLAVEALDLSNSIKASVSKC